MKMLTIELDGSQDQQRDLISECQIILYRPILYLLHFHFLALAGMQY